MKGSLQVVENGERRATCDVESIGRDQETHKVIFMVLDHVVHST